jgi:hypothetical protein
MMDGVYGMPGFQTLAARVYVAARDGAVDGESGFDLACLVLDYFPLSVHASELAALCAEGADGARIAEAARLLLDETFEPGFAEEPAWFASLSEALDRVNADMRATGLPGTARLIIPEWSDRNAWVETWDGHHGSGSGISPASARDPVTALAEVADEAQDAVMETIWAAWPVCPAHEMGVHIEVRDGAVVWWCTGSGGHVFAPSARGGGSLEDAHHRDDTGIRGGPGHLAVPRAVRLL